MNTSAQDEMRLNPYKKGFRTLGIAESFLKRKPWSILCGVVMRRDLQVDGVAITKIKVGGLDATDGVLRIYRKLGREDINVIMLNGCIISWFNIVDLEEVYRRTQRPVICLTYEESEGLEGYIKEYFGEDGERLNLYRKLGEREVVHLRRTGAKVYVRYVGVERREVEAVLNELTLAGAVPEPLRLAGLIARAVLRFIYMEDFSLS